MEPKLKAHFLSIYCMTVADHEAHPKELELMYKIGTEHYGLTPEEINQAILSEGTAVYVPDEPMEKILYLYDLALIVWADGKKEDSEVLLLKLYAKKFGVAKEQVDTIVEYLLEKAQNKASREEIIKELNQ